jgi:RNA polymerase sigma-70 factor (ECF subfamily)
MGPISENRARWLARCILPHEAALRAWLRRKAAAGFDIDDIIQETYAILAAKADIDSIHNPKAYMFQVAYSVILQELRHARVVPILAVPEIGELELVSDAPSPEATVLAREELAIVQRAIEAMPRQTRRAFTLRRVEGVSQAEIARLMHLSEHSVEKHIARGIKLLTTAFRDRGETAPRASSKETEPEKRDTPETNRGIH